MTRTLVTGAAGFIGSHLSRLLAERGHEVVALDSLESGQGWGHVGSVAERVEADLESVLPVDGPVGAVFHMASLTDTTDTDAERIEAQNVGGFRRVLAAAAGWGAPVVYASSASVYGQGGCPQRVGDAFSPQSPYAESKVALERLAAGFAPGHAAPVAGLRFFNVFGSAEDHKGPAASMVTRICRQTARGRVRLFHDGGQSRDFVPVESVCAACAAAWEGGAAGVFNVGTGRPISFNRVAAIAQEEIGQARIEYFDCPFPFFQQATEASLEEGERAPGWDPVDDPERWVRAHACTFA